MVYGIELLGFKSGKSGAHSSRSMMIAELNTLLEMNSENFELSRIKNDIENYNVLHKPTANSRCLTFRHLADLYGLSDEQCLFRNFRKLWVHAPESGPVLALQLALCRDPLLRLSLPLILTINPGEILYREMVEGALETYNPGGYSAASKKSFAQNINGTWTQAGFLHGRIRKVRIQPRIYSTNVAFALFIAKLQGFEGQRAFNMDMCKLLNNDVNQLYSLAAAASARGYMRYKQSGDVIEASFPGWLTDSEKEQLNG